MIVIVTEKGVITGVYSSEEQVIDVHVLDYDETDVTEEIVKKWTKGLTAIY